ncbi:MAG: hypothetical protein OHK0041_15070 [Anaerolineales bacterium]
MNAPYWILTAALLLTSCNLTAVQPTPTASLPSTPAPASPTPNASTPTLLPIETLLAVDTPTLPAPPPTATPRVVLALPKDQPVNCRFGPEVSYAIVGALIVGRQAEVIGRNTDATWWYVRNPSDPSTNCWLSAEFVVVMGNVEALPVVSPPEIGVTNIRVRVEPPVMNVACTAFPQVFSVFGQITANGPTIVTWRWEASNGYVSEPATLLFESEGTKEVSGFLTVGSVNDYWVNLHVLIPNERSGGATFKVVCTP